MNKEIERKFLLTKRPDFIVNASSVHIQQGYIALPEQGNEVRLRQAGQSYTLTVKSNGQLIRDEYEIELSHAQFIQLWPSTKGARLQKKRHYYKENGFTYEIDEYVEPLNGLLVVEIEFQSKAEAIDFLQPEWLGPEVTHLNFMKNKKLLDFPTAQKLFSKLKNYL